MLNLSDNELDNLSREAAEKFEPAENAQSWNKLEQLLDKNLGKPSPVPKIIKPGMPFIYSGAILIAISLIYFLTKSKKDIHNSTLQNSAATNQQQSNKNSERDSNSVAFLNKKQEAGDKEQGKQVGENDIVNKKTGSKEQDARNKIQATKDKVQDEQNAKNGLVDNAASNKKKEKQFDKNDIANNGTRDKEQDARNKIQATKDKERDEKNDLVNKKASNEKQGKQDEKNNGNKITLEKPADKNSVKNNLLASNNSTQRDYASAGNQHHGRNVFNDKKNKNNIKLSKENTDESNSSETNQQDENVKFASVPGIASSGGTLEEINDSALRNFSTKNQLSNIINVKKHNRTAFVNRSLQFGFLFAPEFSKVKYIYDNNRVGNSFGFTLSYQLLGKLSVNSGVIFSKKYYQADKKQFHGPTNAAGNNFDIEFVNASANVIDIPINLRYNYFSDANSTFFINGGFSSYLMQKENFDYYCNYYNAGFQYQGWVAPKPAPTLQKNYLFSIINFSAGFETSFSNSFSFQFEPYLKLPLKGIGFGKVDLSSYGINMSVKFAPVLKRGRR